jgi:hypothetical protein
MFAGVSGSLARIEREGCARESGEFPNSDALKTWEGRVTCSVAAATCAATVFILVPGRKGCGAIGAGSWAGSSVHFDALTIFGLAAVTAMLILYSLEDRAPVYTIGFAVACFMGSAYGFLQGAWPFGLVEAIWGVVAIRKWFRLASNSR